MPNKPARTIADQIQLLKSRGMYFRDEPQATTLLKNISYYRLKGYWWDMQSCHTLHTFKPNTYFEEVVECYNFDRHLRLILFDAWKILEVASLGTLSKLYKNLTHQLPEKSAIAKEMGLNMHNELSSWLEAHTYIRNIIAHHSRLWSRNMVKSPTVQLNNPIDQWFNNQLTPVCIFR